MKFKTKIATLAITFSTMLVQSVWAQKPNEIHIKFEDEHWEEMAPKLQRKYVYGEKGMLALFKMAKEQKSLYIITPTNKLPTLPKAAV